jgi:hypothetical protein
VVPLARAGPGKIDTDRNPLFYDGVLQPGEYAAWLRDNAVDAVALGASSPVDFSGVGRARPAAPRQRRRTAAGLARRALDVWRTAGDSRGRGRPCRYVGTDRAS